MSPNATPAAQTAAATTVPNGNQAGHQSQTSAISATPATQNARRCRQVPRLRGCEVEGCKVEGNVNVCAWG